MRGAFSLIRKGSWHSNQLINPHHRLASSLAPANKKSRESTVTNEASQDNKTSTSTASRKKRSNSVSRAQGMPPPTSKDGPRTRFSSSSNRGGSMKRPMKKPPAPIPENQLTGEIHDADYIREAFSQQGQIVLKPGWETTPKVPIAHYMQVVLGKNPGTTIVDGYVGRTKYYRATLVANEEMGIIGQGDATTKREAERLAALSAAFQLHGRGMLENPIRIKVPIVKEDPTIKLSTGESVNFERARQFMDYYCRRFSFGRPDIAYEESKGKKQSWDAIMTVGGRRIGIGNGATKKLAMTNCYLDVAQYLESCDAELWANFSRDAAQGKDAGLAPKVLLQMSESLSDDIRDIGYKIRNSNLYRNRPSANSPTTSISVNGSVSRLSQYERPSDGFFETKNLRLKTQLDLYRTAPEHARMRETRAALPVYTRIVDLLETIDKNDVTICMAATGSGKTTQVPQLILDQWIDQGQGAKCNVICTQPRRIAAISVAERVAAERGEIPGRGTVGYQVRFEAKLPSDHGSVTFCTTGIFLKRMQSALQGTASGGRSLDDVTHIVVDEVHERDVDTDLVLVVLKRLLADRKARGLPIKIILMSATIDPTLFQNYFKNDEGNPAPVSEIPGRAFPVEKKFLNEVLKEFGGPATLGPSSWVFNDKAVANYIAQEISPQALVDIGFASSLALTRQIRENSTGEDLDMPFPLIALAIAHVLRRSDEGHVLVFLPGWDEIQQVQRILMDPFKPLLGIDFTLQQHYSIHVLHSNVPIAEQQAVFAPAAPGVRRIILATNIAETSITIPDVVYVVDTGKVKEQRYDPERHISSLISAWVGSSNLHQRAGRAGRHRPGEYYGLVSESRLAQLNPYQLVEIKRVDLSNVVMHVKALNFPGVEVEDVLAQAIEPPAPERIAAAMESLKMVGALDENKNLTSLGKVLLQIPIDVQMGRLVLFGSFFKCLDPALTLAAILTNRDPFVNPPLLKKEAKAARERWSPIDFRSDTLATLQAYNAWWDIQGRRDYSGANQFCSDNFLSKPSLMTIQRLKGHLLQAMYHAGVIRVSAGGVVSRAQSRDVEVPPELNVNAGSLPLLASLIAIGTQPNYAIRISEKMLRTSHDRSVFIHPASVNNRKREVSHDSNGAFADKQLFSFVEKSRNVSTPGASNAQTFIKGSTRLDPLTYLLFGAHELVVTEQGLVCDGWLPMKGQVDVLDDIQTLRTSMDECMLRVFEGIIHHRRELMQSSSSRIPAGFLRVRAEEEAEDVEEDEDEEPNTVQIKRDPELSPTEINEFDMLTRDIARVLERFSEERMSAPSRRESRPATPSSFFNSPTGAPRLQLPRSGHSTPYGYGQQSPRGGSRPATPSNLRSSSLYRLS